MQSTVITIAVIIISTKWFQKSILSLCLINSKDLLNQAQADRRLAFLKSLSMRECMHVCVCVCVCVCACVYAPEAINN